MSVGHRKVLARSDHARPMPCAKWKNVALHFLESDSYARGLTATVNSRLSKSRGPPLIAVPDQRPSDNPEEPMNLLKINLIQ